MDNREYVIVGRRMKVPVASADGTRLIVREFQAGERLRRSDFDRFRNKATMLRTGHVRDPLTPVISPVTMKPVELPTPAPAKVHINSYEVDRVDAGGNVYRKTITGYDRKAMQPLAVLSEVSAVDQPVRRKRGRPRKNPGA